MVFSALVLGVLGSLHCLGMCGPIAFMLPLERDNKAKKLMQLSIYHLGRLLAYAILGFAFGFVGKGLQLFGVQQKLSIAIGAIMILLVIIPIKYRNGIALARPVYRLISKVKSKLGRELKKRTPDTFLTIGFLNGFLPCGLVYMAILGAIAMGTPMQGAFYMALFGLGTVPLMTSVIFISSFFGQETKVRVRRLIPVFVAIVGLLFILRGLGLGIPYVSPPSPTTVEIASGTMECH